MMIRVLDHSSAAAYRSIEIHRYGAPSTAIPAELTYSC
jgi:hypothetical protein